MKDTKFYPLLAISIVLLLASFIMLCILGYNYYTKTEQDKQLVLFGAKNNTSSLANTRDSLQKVYKATVNNFQANAQIDSVVSKADSLKDNLNSKLTDFNTLRNEIALLLKDNGSVADLTLAKQKIGELQLKLDELRNKNIDIENENRRLNAMIAQLTNGNAGMQTTRQTDNLVRTVAEKNNQEVAALSVSDLHLTANTENEVEVAEADKTDKFVGSFVVKNNASISDAELMVVVIQPDGKVLKNAWESGSFDTNEGRRTYSRKIKFDYSKGETKRLNFSLPTDACQKGNYIMQLYNKGKVIGKVVKTVS